MENPQKQPWEPPEPVQADWSSLVSRKPESKQKQDAIYPEGLAQVKQTGISTEYRWVQRELGIAVRAAFPKGFVISHQMQVPHLWITPVACAAPHLGLGGPDWSHTPERWA